MKNIDDKKLAKLVIAAQKGEESSLAELIKATEQELMKFLMFLVGNRPLAQDLAQDTYIKVIDSLSQLRDPMGFSSWFLRVAKNLYIDHVRSPRNSEKDDVNELVDLAIDEDQAQAVREVQDLLQPLEPQDRYAVLLVYLEGYSYDEAASMVGITENALRSRLHRAKDQMLAKRRK